MRRRRCRAAHLGSFGYLDNGLMVVSTIPRDELKTKINAQLDAVFAQVTAGLAQAPRPGQQLHAEEFFPAQVGALPGEFRQFRASNEEQKIRGETVHLGEESFSVAWALVGPEDTFDAEARRYRELASLIKRVIVPPAIDVPAVGQQV